MDAVPAPDPTAEPEGFVVVVDAGDRIHFLDWGGPTPIAAGAVRHADRGRAGRPLVHGLARRPGSGRRSRAGSAPPGASSRWTCAVTACPTPRPRTAPTTSTLLAEDVVAVAEGSGLGGRDDRIVLAGHGFGAIVAAAAARRPRGTLCRLSCSSTAAGRPSRRRPASTSTAFLRGLDEPPEVLRSMTAFLADRAAFDPATWDADQERAARATVVETHAGRVVAGHAAARARGVRPHDVRVRPDRRRSRAVAAPVVALAAAASGDDAPGARDRALAAASAARVAAGRGADPRRVVRPRRAQPDAVPSRCGQRGHPGGRDARRGPGVLRERMQVVYTPAHLGHDITVETFMGEAIPANEVAERAEIIRATLEADGGFALSSRPSTATAPITAVHDQGLVRFLEVAWSEVRRQQLAAPFLSADTYPNVRMFEGMSAEAVERLVREPEQAAGRAGFWGLDSAAPLVAGTYVAARGAVDVALTTVDLVLGGAASRLRPVPPARPPRRAVDVRRLLLLQQRRHRRPRDHGSDRRARRDPRCRLPPRQRQPADLLAARRRALHLDPRGPGRAPTRTSWGVPTRPARARAPART